MGHPSPFTSLSPLSWPADIANRDPSALAELLSTTLANAQLLIDSIPTPTPPPQPSSDPLRPSTATGDGSSGGGRARSHTAPSSPSFSRATAGTAREKGDGDGGRQRTRMEEEEETVRKLRGEWKDLKMLPKGKGDSSGSASNPHGIAMYKMGAKDGKGAWFARRSLHRGGVVGGFEKWEAALRREMQETLARVKAEPGKEPGTGNIRGIGAERRVDGVEFEEGKMDLYHVSARFPGPTTPRDFMALIMTPREVQKRRQPRQFMIVSRPCEHPDCPPRSGFIRGTYESVELIREIPVEKPLRRVRSSIDFSKEEREGIASGRGEHISRDAMLRAAKRATGDEVESEGEAGTAHDGDGSDAEMDIEWLMVTRSDPGGSVPRFMVEKGTPGGIMNDAGKFLKWLSSQTIEDLTKPLEPQEDGIDTKPTGELPTEDRPGQAPANASVQDQLPDGEADQHEEAAPPVSNGIYGILTSALGAATSAVASRVAAFAPVTLATDSDFSDDDSDISDATFESAEEGSATNSDTVLPNGKHSTHPSTNTLDVTPATDGTSIRSADSAALSETTSQALSREPTPSSGEKGGAGISQAQAQHEKELRKLQQRMRKAQDKLERAQARRRAKHGGGDGTTSDANPDAAADATLAKLREKHEREVARQEDKYRKEMQRLADKRAAEERKAEVRRRKAAEKEERASLAMELERARAERDVARKEVEMLRERVGELQAQNTRLVARLGREGVDLSAEELRKEGN